MTPAQQLIGKLHLGLPAGHEQVAGMLVTAIAAGPISKQPGTIANRVVLVASGQTDRHSQFAVYMEMFPNYPDVKESHFSDGNYFKADQLVEATKRFAQRVTNNAGYLTSLYRDEPVAPAKIEYTGPKLAS
jgi:hypothetical protein